MPSIFSQFLSTLKKATLSLLELTLPSHVKSSIVMGIVGSTFFLVGYSVRVVHPDLIQASNLQQQATQVLGAEENGIAISSSDEGTSLVLKAKDNKEFKNLVTQSYEQVVLASPSPLPTSTFIPASSPSPTTSPTPSPTASPSVSPSPNPTATPSASPSSSPVVTPSASPEPSLEPSPSPRPLVTPSPSASPVISPEPSPTPSPVVDPSPSITPSPSPLSSPEPSPSLDPSPSPELVPSPSPSPSPDNGNGNGNGNGGGKGKKGEVLGMSTSFSWTQLVLGSIKGWLVK